MKFLITDPDGLQEILQVSKSNKNIQLKYGQGYASSYIGKVACELQETPYGIKICIEDEEITLDYSQADYLRKVLNAWDKHLNSPWQPQEERKESIYKLKKGKK